MQPSNYRSSILLACGALLGALLAASGVVEKPLPENPADPVASVNGEVIGKQEFLSYLDLLARDKRNRLSSPVWPGRVLVCAATLFLNYWVASERA